MEFKPEDLNFHREAYHGILAAMRPKDYPLLMKKEVIGRINLRHRRPNPYTRNGKAMVSFVVAGKNLKEDVRRAIDLLGGLPLSLKAQDRVLLKPNYNSDDPPPGSTALDFLTAVIDLLREHGCTRITVGESAGRPWVPTEKVFKKTGLAAKMAELKIPLLDFDRSPYLDVPVDGEFFEFVGYPKEMEEFDKIVYLPTLKTHFAAGFSMSLKLTVGLTHLFDRMALHGDNQPVCLPAGGGNGNPGQTGPDPHGRENFLYQRRTGDRTGRSSGGDPGLGRSRSPGRPGGPPAPELCGRESFDRRCLDPAADPNRGEARHGNSAGRRLALGAMTGRGGFAFPVARFLVLEPGFHAIPVDKGERPPREGRVPGLRKRSDNPPTAPPAPAWSEEGFRGGGRSSK